MLLLTFAASRFARLWPPLKIGKVIWGEKLQTCVPEPKSPESWELVEPIEPVRVMVGKNAARAAPMFAFAAFNVCSASRMSGRHCTRSEGSPAGLLVTRLG